MEHDKQYHGVWYLPQKKDEVFTGTFYYTRTKGCYIEIVGAFEDVWEEAKEHEIILGKVVEGRDNTNTLL